MDLWDDLRASVDVVAFAEKCGMDKAHDMELEPRQKEILRTEGKRQIFCCCRQFGKSTLASIKALYTAVVRRQLVLVLAPTLRQSGEIFSKVKQFYRQMDDPPEAVKDTTQELELVTGGRIVSLPSKEGNVRGFSKPGLIIEDESAWIDDAVRVAISPMLARSGGELLLVSTPNGRIGHFYNSWLASQRSPNAPWIGHKYTADDCKWLDATFLSNERLDMTESEYRQEYFCEFQESGGQVFRNQDIEAARARGLEMLGLTEDDMQSTSRELMEGLREIRIDPLPSRIRPQGDPSRIKIEV